jgi:dTDP-glucose pyrophosphorylase
MAGRGSRFVNAGYTVPKPLIPMGGKPMIQWVIENVRPDRPHVFTFICLAEHLEVYPEVKATLRRLSPGCNIVAVDHVTEGAACSVLLAKHIINNQDALMIANADQFVDLAIDHYLEEMDRREADGIIMTFWSDHPKWSYCRMRPDGTVGQVVEKKVISNEATVGIYNFRNGADFVWGAERMIERDLRVNNEFYVAPVYDQLIDEGKKIVVMPTGREYQGMFGLGTPEDLDFFLSTTRYEEGRSKSLPLSDANDFTPTLLRLYAGFFAARNIAGIVALLHLDGRLIDPNGELKGRTSIGAYISKLFAENTTWKFIVKTSASSDSVGMLEFELESDTGTIWGVDVIRFSGREITTIHTYIRS